MNGITYLTMSSIKEITHRIVQKYKDQTEGKNIQGITSCSKSFFIKRYDYFLTHYPDANGDGQADHHEVEHSPFKNGQKLFKFIRIVTTHHRKKTGGKSSRQHSERKSEFKSHSIPTNVPLSRQQLKHVLVDGTGQLEKNPGEGER